MSESPTVAPPLVDHAPAMRCPTCGADGLAVVDDQLTCPACTATFGHVDDRTFDLAPHAPASSFGAPPSERSVWLEQIVKQRTVQAVTGLTYAGEAGWMRRKVMPVDGPVVEVACGLGREARKLAALLGGGRVIATDIDPHKIARAEANSRGTGITFVRADATRMPFRDGACGAVNTFGALHLVPDPRAVVVEAGRILAPGGTFTGLTVMWRPGVLGAPFAALKPVTHGMSETDFRAWCADAGLADVEVVHHRGLATFAAKRPV